MNNQCIQQDNQQHTQQQQQSDQSNEQEQICVTPSSLSVSPRSDTPPQYFQQFLGVLSDSNDKSEFFVQNHAFDSNDIEDKVMPAFQQRNQEELSEMQQHYVHAREAIEERRYELETQQQQLLEQKQQFEHFLEQFGENIESLRCEERRHDRAVERIGDLMEKIAKKRKAQKSISVDQVFDQALQ
jgi:hypothetical protein